MNININLSNFIKKHKSKKNQVIFHKADCKNNKIIVNNQIKIVHGNGELGHKGWQFFSECRASTYIYRNR